jgi:hypothetical protein
MQYPLDLSSMVSIMEYQSGRGIHSCKVKTALLMIEKLEVKIIRKCIFIFE